MIARGYQFQPEPDPFVQYGQMQQLEQNRQTNALNQMKMQEMQQGMDETNAMRRFDPSSPTYVQDITKINPKIGFALAKSQQEAKTAGTEGQIKDVKLLSEKLAMLPDAYRRADTPEAYMAVHNYVHSDPVIGPFLKRTGATPEKGMAQIEKAIRTGNFNELRMGSMQSVSQLLESMKPLVVSPSASVYDSQSRTYIQAPAAPAAAAKPPEKIEIMRALGYSIDAAGDAAYEAAKRAAPTVSAPTGTLAEMEATGIPKTQEGLALYYRLKEKAPVIAPEPTTNEIKNAKAIALGAGPEGSVAYNQSLQTQLLRLTAKNESVAAPPSMVAEYTFAKTPDGGNFKGTYQQFVTARAAAGRAPAPPRAEQPPVAVTDSITGKPVFVSREEALRGRMTPAAAMESLPPKEIQKREAALPQATSAVKGFESKSSKFIADLTALRDDPGLENITGPVFGRTGSVSQAGSRAQALYDKVVAKGGFQALQDLRDASKTGGALGNVSNQEGKQLTASFAAIDRRQNAEDVRAAINQAIEDIQGTKTRMREAYDSTYAYKSGGESQTSKPASAAPNIDALLNKYK
jgi:hypothetical protein